MFIFNLFLRIDVWEGGGATVKYLVDITNNYTTEFNHIRFNNNAVPFILGVYRPSAFVKCLTF